MKKLLLACASVTLISGPAASAELSSNLGPLSFLAGSCWKGPFAKPPGTDKHCFTPMLGGRYLRDVHVVEGAPFPYSGESVYRWNPELKTITYSYFASDGGYSTGVAEAIDGGLRFADEYVGPSGEHMKMRVSWLRNGSDGYTNKVEVMESGAWRELWSTRFEKVSQAPGAD